MQYTQLQLFTGYPGVVAFQQDDAIFFVHTPDWQDAPEGSTPWRFCRGARV